MVLTTLISDSINDFDHCTLILLSIINLEVFHTSFLFFYVFHHVFLRFSFVNLIGLIFVF